MARVVERAFLLAVAPFTLLVGMAMVEAAAGSNSGAESRLISSLIAASLAPLVAVVLLYFVAPGFDVVLVVTAGMLTSIGTTSLVLLARMPGPDQPFYQAIVERHALFVPAAFAALIAGATAAQWIHVLRRYPFTLLGLALLFIVVTVLIGETVNGSRLWLRIGPVQFQPSEIARLFLVGFVASYLYERRHLVAAAWRVGSVDLPPLPHLVPLAAAVVIASGVLVLQNDLGMAALVALGALATFISVRQSKVSVLVAALILAIACAGAFSVVPRVRDRVDGWLDPWRDPAERGFQFVQAEFSLAGGGVAGNGVLTPGGVPEVHTDLILVAIGSRLGWMGATAVLVLIAILVCRCVLVALLARDGFSALVAFSLAALIGIQVLLIAGGTVRVLPLTGLTFPLVSYGGTSLIATGFALGVVAGLRSQSTRARWPSGAPGLAPGGLD